MAHAALCLAVYALCFTSFLAAFPTKGFVGDWRHLSSGLTDLRSSANGAWRKDGSQPLENNHEIFTDGNYDVILPKVAHLATDDSKLENSEKAKRTFPVLKNNPRRVRTTGLRSQQPHHTPALGDSSQHDEEQSFKFKYGVLRILTPRRLAKHVEENDKLSHDSAGDATASDGDRSVVARGLELQKPKFNSKKSDSSNDDFETKEGGLLSADEEIEHYVSDECGRCDSPVRKEKRDTGNHSVEITTPNPKANVSNNFNETSGKSENNTDDSNKKPISRLLDLQVTTSQPPSTTIKHGQRKLVQNHEEPKERTEMSVKSVNGTTTEEVGGLMRIEDDFAYITDPQELHLGQGRDLASGKFVSSRGKIITLHWTIKFEPKSNDSVTGEHPHPPADDGRDVYEQVVYLDPDTEGSPADGHTTDIPKHTGDISEYLDQLPLPNGAAQVFANLQTGELPPIGQDETADIAIAPVMELLSQKPITEPSEDWFTPQDELVDLLDQPSSNGELVDGLVDMEPGLPVSIPFLQEELVELETTDEGYEPGITLDEPFDMESETVVDIPSILEVEYIVPVPDMELLSQYPTTSEDLLTPDVELVDMESDTLADTEDLFMPDEELVDMESDTLANTEDLFTPDEELVDMESDTLADILSVPEVEDIPSVPEMELLSQQPPEDLFTPDEELVVMESDTLADTEDVFMPDEVLVDMESDTLANTEDLFMPDEELVDMESDTLPDILPVLEVEDVPTAPDMELLSQHPPEDLFTPDEELAVMESDTLANTEDLFMPDEELVDMQSDTLPDILSVLEVEDVPTAPDMELLSQHPPEDLFTPDEELVVMESDTLADIPSVLEEADVPTAPDMELLSQQPPEDWFTPEEGLVDMESDALVDISSILEVVDVPAAPDMELLSQQPTTWSPEDGLLQLDDGSDGLEPGLPVSIPSLQDELVDMETAGDDYKPDTSLDEPVYMESESAYLDPNTLANSPSMLEVADLLAAPDSELLSQQLITKPPEDLFMPQEELVYTLDQPSLDNVLMDGPIDMDSEIPVSIPSLQDDLVDVETEGVDFNPDPLLSIPSSLGEPAAMESEDAYFDPNTLTNIPSMLEVADVPTASDVESLLQQPLSEQQEDWITSQEGIVYPVDQSSSDIVLSDAPVGMEPEISATIPSLQDELVDIEAADYEPDASLHEPVDMESDSANLDPNTLADIPSILEVADIPTAPDTELLPQQPIAVQPEDSFMLQEEPVYPQDQPSLDNVLMDGSVDTESGIPVSIPSLQDELVDMETADVDYNPDALLSIPSSLGEPIDMESESTYFDPNTLADIVSTMDEPDVMTSGLADMLGDVLTGEQSEPTTVPYVSSLLDEPVAMQPELSASPVEESTGEELYPDALSNVESSLNEPDAAAIPQPVYNEYGLDIYEQEDYGDHIDHPQGTTCWCELVNNQVVTDRP